MSLEIEVYKPDPQPKVILIGDIGNAHLGGLILTVPETEEFIAKLEDALAKAELL